MRSGKRILISALMAGTALCACFPQTDKSDKTAGDEAVIAMDYAASGWTAKTLPELSAALQAGEVTSEALVNDYITRVMQMNRKGPNLRALMQINPNALDQAREIDRRRVAGETLPLLAGLPVVIKDNIETADPMATTAGAFALAENMTRRDSPLAAGLRREGAIILGKSNLSQWANFRSERSISGWSARGGQVRNPHILNRSPCGSSSGSGAAVAASLAAGAVGTETNGSIICPSNVNGIVGFKPTVGLVPQKHIIPISASQDTAGPMTKTVTGAAMMLSAMATYDNGESREKDFLSGLSDTSLNGTKVGVMRFSLGDNPDIIARFNAALEVMEAQGAELVEITEFERDSENWGGNSYEVLLYEFKDGLNHYLQTAAKGVTTRSLSELITFNEDHIYELSLFDQSIFKLAETKGPLTDPAYIDARDDVQRAAGSAGIDMMMAKYDVAVLVGPSGPLASQIDPVNGDVWPSWVGAGNLAAVAGYPHLTVPMGDVHGVPIGLSFMAGKDHDGDVLSYGYDYEQASQMRPTPKYLRSSDERPEIKVELDR